MKKHFKVLNPLRILFIFGLLWDGLRNVPCMLFLAPGRMAERGLWHRGIRSHYKWILKNN